MSTSAADESRGGGSAMWVQGLACGTMAALAPAAALQLVVLLAPGIAALMLDRQPGKPIARTVLLFALAACVDPIRAAWDGVQAVGSGMAMLGDPYAIGTAWSAAGAGWLLSQLTPLGVGIVLESARVSRAARLRAEQAKLAEEWGLETLADQ